MRLENKINFQTYNYDYGHSYGYQVYRKNTNNIISIWEIMAGVKGITGAYNNQLSSDLWFGNYYSY